MNKSAIKQKSIEMIQPIHKPSEEYSGLICRSQFSYWLEYLVSSHAYRDPINSLKIYHWFSWNISKIMFPSCLFPNYFLLFDFI